MPWKESDAMDQRHRFVVRASSKGACMSRLCKEYGISRPTGYKWLSRYKAVGLLSDLSEHSRRPRSSPNQTSPPIEQRVLELRAIDNWGSRKIRKKLSEEEIGISRDAIDRILRDHGLHDKRLTHCKATKRFVREKPNELLQMDFKGDLKLRGGQTCYPLSLFDDHSRFIVSLDPLLSQGHDEVKASVVRAFEEYGVPESLLMDHGIPWWSSTSGHGLTRFAVFLIRQGVALRYSGIRHPQTQGKIERYHRVMKESLRHHGQPQTLEGLREFLKGFRERYNEIRPHESLNLEVPLSKYVPSKKAYDPTPRRWEYPENAEVRKISVSGNLYLAGRYRFVSHALPNRRVCLQRHDDQVIVIYRHMIIRQFDLSTGKTHPAVKPWGNTGHH